jgi:hypothetical protein
MTLRNTRVLVCAAVLLALPFTASQGQAPQPPPPQPEPATPMEGGDPQPPAAAQAPPAAPAPLKPEDIGLSFAPPEGWQQGDPTKFTLPGEVCCVWSPDNTSSIVAFVQKPGRPLSPKVLLDQSAQAFQGIPGAQVKAKDLGDFGGMRGFSLVVTAPGNGAAIDGKGVVPTTQHWIAIPRQEDVVIFLMTTPDEKFAQYEQAFQALLGTLKVSGTQTPDQRASK